MSGAGKSQALKCFEDFGFFCVDNLPVALLPRFAELLEGSRHLDRVALGIDIREGEFLKSISQHLELLRRRGLEYQILFFDASDAVLLRRFSETRHRHPLGKKLVRAIRNERKKLFEIKGMADKVVDTTSLTLGELKEILSGVLRLTRTQDMSLSVISFGYKFGLPMDADLVMDVRFLPNPNYHKELKNKTGEHLAVQRYILSQGGAKEFLTTYTRLLQELLPLYIREGKSYLTLAIGCTGGHHRSVFVAEYLAKELRKGGYAVGLFHRDIDK
ncbi:MAG: RNase adapter RapZ [Elusimicrobia bacterium]|nr:RNase adapter RapZ [Elusimicrobiota bacterium]